MLENLMLSIAQWRMNTRRRTEFYRMLALLHRNVGDLLSALRDIEGNYSDDGRHPYNPIAMMAAECADVFEGGGKLSAGLADWMPDEESMLVAAGEEAGNLQDGLRRAQEAAERAERINKALSKLIYPAAMLAGVGVLMQQVSTAVVPQLMRVSRGADMSFAGEALKAIAAVVNTLGLYGAGGAVLVILTVFATLPVWTGPLRVLAEGAPPWSLYRDLRGASFLAQLTLLQGGGVRLEDALTRLWELASPWLRERINALLQGVRNGLTLGNAAYEAGYDFPAPAAIRFLRTIAGNEESAHSIEEFAQDWYVYTLERLEKLIVTVSTGGVLFFYGVIFLIYGAMNDITNVMVAAPGGAR